jgi:hypothetical protein
MCTVTSKPRDPSQIRSHAFEGTTPEFLRRAVKLGAASRAVGDTVTVSVEVKNVGAGHHVPTGVTLRNLILVVSIRDRDEVPLEQLSGPTVPNWGGVGDPAAGNLAGLPGKGYARVLVDEFLAENVLFTEAVSAFDNRIPAGATDSSAYTFRLPKDWRKRGIRTEVALYYRRAFKPIADQRKWNIPLGPNAHGTRGDGTDYDENFVMARARNFLSCTGKLRRLRIADVSMSGNLELTGTLKLPRLAAFDPVADGVQISLGTPARPSGFVQEALSRSSVDGRTIQLRDSGTGTMVGLRLTPAGHGAYRMAMSVSSSDATLVSERRLALGLDSGEVCFAKTVRCKSKRATFRCR